MIKSGLMAVVAPKPANYSIVDSDWQAKSRVPAFLMMYLSKLA